MENDYCFACGMYDGGTDRAHILARCEGGTDDVENLHLLCNTCHKDSEIISGDRYTEWLLERSVMDMLMSRAFRSGFNLAKFISHNTFLQDMLPPQDISQAARISAAMQYKRSKNEVVGAVPYGKRLADDGVLLLDDPSEQAVILLARELKNSGLSLREVSRELATLGHFSRNGKQFHASQVMRMIKIDSDQAIIQGREAEKTAPVPVTPVIALSRMTQTAMW